MRFNLTWWRKRPSVHVADYQPDVNTVDISSLIAQLDPAKSVFHTLLMPETITVKDISHIAVGSHLDLPDKGIRRVTSIRRAHPDDWFAEDEWVLTLRKPYMPDDPFSASLSQARVEWFEDKMFPRLARG